MIVRAFVKKSQKAPGREIDRAFVCRDYACRMPAGDITTLAGQLADTT